ncbi:unnamed protein product [Dovyalis caffra]|uniref:Uncharacterized protein n=1 Tax=Dovyalis caffra TaxID=77055 RepID=A0AAV1SPG1_9ROSI|nr:unnamed protein product [Dovyalis caffra]
MVLGEKRSTHPKVRNGANDPVVETRSTYLGSHQGLTTWKSGQGKQSQEFERRLADPRVLNFKSRTRDDRPGSDAETSQDWCIQRLGQFK